MMTICDYYAITGAEKVMTANTYNIVQKLFCVMMHYSNETVMKVFSKLKNTRKRCLIKSPRNEVLICVREMKSISHTLTYIS